MEYKKFCKILVMNLTYPSLILASEWENLQHSQEIMIPCLIMCTPTKEIVLLSMCWTLQFKKKTIHVKISKCKNPDYIWHPDGELDHSTFNGI